MPRISKTDTLFKVNDTIWLTRFEHQHTAEGKPIFFTSKVGKHAGEPREVQHITTCKLGLFSKPRMWVTGVSPCSLKDVYNWRKGIIRAFKKALEKAGYCKFTRHEGREIVVALKTDYEAMIDNFVAALAVRDYAPHNQLKGEPVKIVGFGQRALPPVVEGIVIKSEDVTVVPAETKNGTAHLGMD